MIRRFATLLALCSLVLCLADSASAQSRGKKGDSCPWCKDDPEVLAKMSLVGHGPVKIGRLESVDFESKIPASQWVFLETKHMRLASSLPTEKLSAKERKRLEPDLARLREFFPKLPKKVKSLDPWLRVHLMALKCEDFYTRFQKLIEVTDEDFPPKRVYFEKYMGNGSYLGEADKFDLIWHTRRSTHQVFTKQLMGASVTDAVRWHLTPEHKLLASIPAEDGDLKSTRWLVPHTVHLMSHLFLCAYKHFSYDPPIWLDEGLAHVLEREVNPLSTTMDGDEGSGPHRGGHQDWTDEDRKLAKSKKTPSFAVMLHWHAFHDVDQYGHKAAYSYVRFLVQEHPEKLAKFIGELKGQLDDEGYPSGKDLIGLQRRLLRELFEWTPAQFDEAWKAWALAPE
ncbi:MAG: hypothetical protein ACI8QC_002943 [Planctomycetota bacterium]|jgi:hypothetical protein